MKDSSLLELLRSFSEAELKEFDSMVKSPFFNKKTSITKFWNLVRKYAPEFNSPNLQRENIYQKLLPGKPYNYGTMKNLIFGLSKLCEKYIELKVYDSKTVDCQLNYADGLLQRGLTVPFEKSLKQIEKSAEDMSIDAGYHYKKFLAEVLRTNYLISRNKHLKTTDSAASLNEYLTMGYFIDVFDCNYNEIFMRSEFGTRTENKFIEAVVELYDKITIEKDFRVRLYYNSFMLLYRDEKKYFDELRKLLNDNVDKISHEQKYNFCVALTNYCMKKNLEGQKEFDRTEHEVYRFMIENNIYSINRVKNIDGSFYTNVAGAAIKTGETKWAIWFIEKFKNMLSVDVSNEYYFKALIEYNIGLKNFEEALKYLTLITNSNPSEKLAIRKWEIVTYYELKMFEELRYRIDASRHYIKNDKKFSFEKKEMLMNLISFVSVIVTHKESRDRIPSEEIDYLKSQIKNSKTYNKEWLIEKADELKSKP